MEQLIDDFRGIAGEYLITLKGRCGAVCRVWIYLNNFIDASSLEGFILDAVYKILIAYPSISSLSKSVTCSYICSQYQYICL